ncbi:MAG: hypothetical protein QOH86_282 [Sphingomonadales bacterium]|jgi:hypothetical protein|nr:hypothetical protein [Sphingomonadales bacterium]
MTGKSQHNPDSSDRPLDDKPGRRPVPATPPDRDPQDPSTIEAFEEEGAGIAAKE